MKKICARFAVAVMLSVSGALTAWLIACGPWLTEYVTVRAIHPADVKTFGTGSLGVVRPPMARRYLVHAYRAWTGKPALPNGLIAPSALDGGYDVIEKWSRDVMTVTGAYGNVSLDRNTGQDYQAIRNCQNDAFATASRTLAARIVKYGSSSAHVADWVAAQTAVFTNCGNAPLTLPPAPRPNADALERADRAYQTAAAYFYAMQYEEAARRFRAIADDPTSPWRPYGHYLAARATIRRAVVPDESAATRDRLLLEAIRELQLTIADPKAAALAKSAAGLLDYIDTRRNPAARLHALSQLLSTAPRVSDQQVADYQILLDRQVGDSVEFGYDAIGKRSAMVEGDDLADWILAMQGSGDQAAARAVARWKETSSVPWLVAALWRTAATDAVAPSLLEAASKLPRTSPAFPTVAFLRARMLIDRGDRAAARELLRTLPTAPDPQFQAESLNLLKALRFRVADSFEELIANAPRTVVFAATDGYDEPLNPGQRPVGTATFDVDAAIVLNYRLPLDRVVEAATAATLPDVLARRLAAAAFTRAVLLGRDDAAMRVAPRLRALTPSLARDLDRYTTASTEADRHIAAIRLLLRTPGLRPTVRAGDDSQSLDDRPRSDDRIDGAPAALPMQRQFDHVFRRNWWCEFEPAQSVAELNDWGTTPRLLAFAYPPAPPGPPEEARTRAAALVPMPAFLTADERAAIERETAAMVDIGIAPDYLAAEAIKWATARPKDLDAAEALAHAVEGARWTCEGQRNPTLARRAFQVLHQTFPQSEWAKKTKYWY